MLVLFTSKQMEDSEVVHSIFLEDPIKLADFVEKNTKIILVNGEVITGVVYTIDPVSQSVVLCSKEKYSEEECLKIVMKHAIVSMEVLNDLPGDQKISFSKIAEVNNILPHTDTERQKNKVKDWLEKNLIPVTINEEVLKVDTLEIHPPYGPDQCICSNSIVMSRIQNLLLQMPS